MPLVLSSSSVGPCYHVNNIKIPHIATPQTSLSQPNYNPLHFNMTQSHSLASKHVSMIPKRNSPTELKTRGFMNSDFSLDDDESGFEDECRDQEGVGAASDMGSPWEGAILYQRNPSISHLEYCTTLERLGLGDLSTEVSKSRASLMGLRVTKAVKDFVHGTPVLVSVDVTRKKKNLRLDGIIRTVITLGCNRCGGPAADSVFSNFSLILTEEPVEEPEIVNMGVIYGGGKEHEEEDDDESSVDLDDWLHFPPEEKTIDISKHIRDMVHLEIRIDTVCDPGCKGLCLGCGQDLNTGGCGCGAPGTQEKSYGPLGGLKEQMQQQRVKDSAV